MPSSFCEALVAYAMLRTAAEYLKGGSFKSWPKMETFHYQNMFLKTENMFSNGARKHVSIGTKTCFPAEPGHPPPPTSKRP